MNAARQSERSRRAGKGLIGTVSSGRRLFFASRQRPTNPRTLKVERMERKAARRLTPVLRVRHPFGRSPHWGPRRHRSPAGAVGGQRWSRSPAKGASSPTGCGNRCRAPSASSHPLCNNAAVETKHRLATLNRIRHDTFRFGVALHLFGDSDAHRRRDDPTSPTRMYGFPAPYPKHGQDRQKRMRRTW
jgi:hypothetical protein